MTSLLGNSFSLKHRESFCKQRLKAGGVFRLYTSSTTPAKVKRFVVIGSKKKINSVGLLFINSDITKNAFKNRNLKRLHLLLESKKRIYLDHDSYLDCSRLNERSYEELLNKCIADINIYLGSFSNTDIAEAQKLVESAKTISPILKRRYGLIK